MSARDELAMYLAAAYGDLAARGPDFDAADALLTAGYQKPLAIATVEELDALPLGSVVRSHFGVTYEKDCDLEDDHEFWSSVGNEDQDTPDAISLPATVLYSPEAA